MVVLAPALTLVLITTSFQQGEVQKLWSVGVCMVKVFSPMCSSAFSHLVHFISCQSRQVARVVVLWFICTWKPLKKP